MAARSAWILAVLLLAGLGSAVAQSASSEPVEMTACPTLLVLHPGETANISAEVHNAGARVLRIEPSVSLRPGLDSDGKESVGLMNVWKLRSTRASLEPKPDEYAPFQWKVEAPKELAGAATDVQAHLGMANSTLALDAQPLVVLLKLVPEGQTHDAASTTECARAGFRVASFPIVPDPPKTISKAGAIVLASLAGGAAAFALAAAAVQARRRGQAWWILGPLVPLFTRLTAAKLLDQATRQRVYEAIQARPGIRFQQIRDELRLSTGVVDHHTRMLAKGGFVRSRKEGRFRAYYAQGVVVPVTTATPLGDTATRVLHRIRTAGEATYAELMADLALSKASVSHHVNALQQRGLVVLAREPDGRWVVRPASAPVER